MTGTQDLIDRVAAGEDVQSVIGSPSVNEDEETLSFDDIFAEGDKKLDEDSDVGKLAKSTCGMA